MDNRLVLLWRWLIKVPKRALVRLRFFPFTLFHMVFNAGRKVVQLRRGHSAVSVAEVSAAATSLPRNVLLWIDRAFTGPPVRQGDVCIRLPRDATDAKLHEVFSVLLTSPRLRSVGLYWDTASLVDDLPLLQARRERSDPTAWATPYEDLGSPGFRELREFFQADHVGIVLPVAAIRDAETLLKREAGGAYAVCLNVPVAHRPLIAAVEATHPDVRLLDLAPSTTTTSSARRRSLHGYGLNLLERMALVQAADAYVGSFDELGCAALVSGRPAFLVGDGSGVWHDGISRGDVAVWFPDPVDPTTLAKAVQAFLSRQLGPVEI